MAAIQNTLWALAAMLDFRSVPKTKILYMTMFNIGPYGNFTFSSFFLKPQNRFESNLAEMFIGGLVVSNKKIFKISTNQNTLWALAAMLDFRSAPKTKILYMTIQ
jgi:hypothetical protein